MSDLPVIIGMNNPHSTDPRLALAPFPAGVAGHRLWAMVSAVCGIRRREWMRRTERHNLCTGDWDPLLARKAGEALWRTLEGRSVAVLGVSVRKALWLPQSSTLSWNETTGVRWFYIPHPSGLCRDYNDPVLRTAVGMRFEELLSR